MRKFIVNQNIERYRRLLQRETDKQLRAVLERLLAEEKEVWESLPDEREDSGRSAPRNKRTNS